MILASGTVSECYLASVPTVINTNFPIKLLAPLKMEAHKPPMAFHNTGLL